MENEKPNYYAVIPAEVRYDHELSSTEKLLYAEISALTNKTGECWASNSYFADLYGVSETWVSICINKLVSKNYLSSYIDKSDGNHRTIKLKLKTSLRKVKDPSLRKVKDNNTSINNIYNNISLSSERLTDLLFEKVKINHPFIDKKPNTKDYSVLDSLLKKYPPEIVEGVIYWSQQDEFWKQNIRSTTSLKKHFETLLVKAKSHQGGKVITI